MVRTLAMLQPSPCLASVVRVLCVATRHCILLQHVLQPAQEEFNRMRAEHESLLDSLDAAERSRQELDGRLKAATIQAARGQRQVK